MLTVVDECWFCSEEVSIGPVVSFCGRVITDLKSYLMYVSRAVLVLFHLSAYKPLKLNLYGHSQVLNSCTVKKKEPSGTSKKGSVDDKKLVNMFKVSKNE